MIKKIAEINSITYTLLGESIIKTIVKKQKNGSYSNQILPIEFEYNGSWYASFNCKKCSKNIKFGENKYQNFTSTGSIFTRTFDEKFLHLMEELFPKTKVYQTTKSQYKFLTNKAFLKIDADVLSIPILTFIYFSCPYCNAEYLCRFRQGYPYEPDPARPEGLIGEIFIDEIIQIEVEEGKRFTDLMEEFKIKPNR